MIKYILGGAVVLTIIVGREFAKYTHDIHQWEGFPVEDDE